MELVVDSELSGGLVAALLWKCNGSNRIVDAAILYNYQDSIESNKHVNRFSRFEFSFASMATFSGGVSLL